MSAPLLSRRLFIATVATAAGGFALGCSASAAAAAVGIDVADDGTILPLLSIGADGVIRIVNPAADMGQGVSTTLPLILVEELDGDWSKVEVVHFDTWMKVPEGITGNDFVAANSNTTRHWFDPMRRCGATARAMLVTAAAARWKVSADSCRTEAGRVVHPDGRQTLGYGTLASDAAKLTPPKDVSFKARADYRLIGKRRDRREVPDKSTGKTLFASDIRMPALVFASARQGPVAGATLKSFDEKAAMAVPGMKRLFPIGNGTTLVALATNTWSAMQALDAASPVFDLKPGAAFDSVTYRASLVEALKRPGKTFDVKGDASAGLAAPAKVVQATYEVPFLAHATMEPMSCVAWMHEGLCEVWAPTQVPFRAEEAVMLQLGLPKDKVRIHQTWLGGGFGRRAETDFIAQAAEIAAIAKLPISLFWTRAEDMQHDFYRPAYAIRCEATLDTENGIKAYRARIAGGSIIRSRRPEWLKPNSPADPTASAGLVPELYPAGAASADWVEVSLPIPIGFWRSVGHSQNMFAVESFIDELAAACGQDGYHFRRARMKDPRAIAVLDKAAELGNWSSPVPAGHGRGIAAVTCYGSFGAMVVEASVVDKAIKLHHVATVIDCGFAIQPDNVIAQIEGAAVFGLSAAMYGEISFKDGAAEQQSFVDYQLLTIGDMPKVASFVMPSAEAPGGVGETGVPTCAPALANALFKITGKRLRRLPLATALT